MGNIWQFDREGIYPSGISSKNGFLAPKPLYNQLNAVFRSAIDHHFAFGGMHGKQEKTVWVEVRATMNFFKHLQDSGAETFHDIENKMVYTFFFNGEQQIRGKDYCSLIKAVLKIAIPLYGEPVQKNIRDATCHKIRQKEFSISDTGGIHENPALCRADNYLYKMLQLVIFSLHLH